MDTRTRRILGTAAIAALALAGCSSTTKTTAAPAVDNPQTTKATTAAAPAKAATIGDSIVLTGPGGVKITATLVRIVDPATLPEGITLTDKTQHPVAVQLRLVNGGTKPWTDSPDYGARLTGPGGQSYNVNLSLETTVGTGFTDPTTIPAGGTALGVITFTVPAANGPATFTYALDKGAGQSGTWTLG